MKRFLIIIAMAAVVAGCGKDGKSGKDDDAEFEEVGPIELGPQAKSMVPKANASGWTLFDDLSDGKSDIIVSPLSMEMALAMLAEGADGDTRKELCDYLGVASIDEFSDFYHKMATMAPRRDNKTKLSISNALVVKEGYPIKKTYLESVKADFDAAVKQMSFEDGKKVASWVNNWCKEATNGMIPKLIDNIGPNDVLLILNALYFNGKWKDPFQKDRTYEEDFKQEGGKTVQVEMMHDDRRIPYLKNEVFSAIRLVYGNGSFCIDIMLPQAGKKVSDIVAALKKNNTLAFERAEVNIALPKFEIEFNKSGINKILRAKDLPISMGIAPDFSPMSDQDLCVSDIVHSAKIRLDETGTEAAAVTSIIVAENAAMPGDEVDFIADHPFLFAISETSTGTILFSGAYYASK